MKQYLSLIFFLFITIPMKSQFPPAAGIDGTTAIYVDSSILVNWASHCYIQRGYMDISHSDSGFVDYGSAYDALNKADNNVVSLGDSGIAILIFPHPICNKNGYDFAVFENGFMDTFLELAFVEVSTDSIHWFRFPSISLTQTDEQIGTFGTLQPEKIYNLAGKYRVLYGTPFELDDIPDNALLDKQKIKYIKIIDVIGSINSLHASYDSQGHIINDPYPTPFNTGGFDLDAVGVIHQCPDDIDNNEIPIVRIYPNPFYSSIYFNLPDKIINVQLFNHLGNPLFFCQNCTSIDGSNFSKGLYFIRITTEKQTIIQRIVKE